MEIFKAAGQQTQQSVAPTHHAHTREIEKTQIQHDAAQKDDDNNLNLSPGELNKKMQEVTQKLNENMSQLNTNIRFSYNAQENTMVVQVREADTGAIIRELPTKEALRIARYFKESIGLLFDKES